MDDLKGLALASCMICGRHIQASWFVCKACRLAVGVEKYRDWPEWMKGLCRYHSRQRYYERQMIARHDTREVSYCGAHDGYIGIVEDEIDLASSMRELGSLQMELVLALDAGYTYSELADRCNSSVDVVSAIVDSACEKLDSPMAEHLEHEAMREKLVSSLPYRWQMCLRLRSRGYTQMEVGKELGISHTMVGRYEHRRIEMSLPREQEGGPGS